MSAVFGSQTLRRCPSAQPFSALKALRNSSAMGKDTRGSGGCRTTPKGQSGRELLHWTEGVWFSHECSTPAVCPSVRYAAHWASEQFCTGSVLPPLSCGALTCTDVTIVAHREVIKDNRRSSSEEENKQGPTRAGSPQTLPSEILSSALVTEGYVTALLELLVFYRGQ